MQPNVIHGMLQVANLAILVCDPNPRVGCVLTDGNGCILGVGYTQQPGGPHAEIMALRLEQASLHGYANYADYALSDTMAGKQIAVLDLLM